MVRNFVVQSIADVNGAAAEPQPVPEPLIRECDAPSFLERIAPPDDNDYEL